MPELLDLKDRKLLYYLSQNARESQTRLAKKVALSKNAVKYRIDRLKKEGVITKFTTTIHLGALGLDTFTLLLKFNEDISQKPEISEFFRNHPFADWVAALSGNWDLFVEFVYRDLFHLHEIVKEIIDQFSGSLNTYQIFFSFEPLRVEHLVKDVYKDTGLEEPPVKERTFKKYSTDETDRKILSVLSQDSSLSYLEITQKLNLTLDIVRYRIKNLLAAGIIIKFTPDLSLFKLGYTEYLYTLKLRNLSKEKIGKLKKTIKFNFNLTYAFFDAVSSHLIFVCAFKSPQQIDALSRSLRKEYSDIIEEQNFMIITEQLWFNLFPKGILEMK